MEHFIIDGMKVDVTIKPGQGKEVFVVATGMKLGRGFLSPLCEALPGPTITFDFPERWNLRRSPLSIPSMGEVAEMFIECVASLKHRRVDLLLGNLLRLRLSMPSMSEMADMTAKLITHLGYERVNFLGASWGGLLALKLAHEHQERIEKLVLVATTPDPTKLFMSDPEVRAAYQLGQYGGKLISREELEGVVELAASSTNFYRALAACGWEGMSVLKDIQCPTLVLLGAEDRIITPAEGRKLLAIPGSQLAIVKGEGHGGVWSSPTRFARPIKRFLKEPVRAVA